ncbi:MAG TPA: hypothetical protein VM429_08935 [Micropruina sp.]|nr:hypothetical protein [Micropruina sp.]
MLAGEMPGYPNLYVPIVDVRDVALAHVRALTAKDAAGQRILLGTGEPAVAMREIGWILREQFGPAAAKVPTRAIPDLVVRVGGLVNPEFRSVAAELGFVKHVSIDRARRVLGFEPRPAREAIIAAGAGMINGD